MASDYARISADEHHVTQSIKNTGKLLAGLYADRTHFIIELLQNAEDALGRRHNWNGSRAVKFQLTDSALRFSHFGKLFDEPDVLSICSIGETTKDEFTEIGRFGIGFKSVYAFTDRPQIHSGSEDFAIEDSIFPTRVDPISRTPDETVFLIPLPAGDGDSRSEIARGLRNLGPRMLLFLRHIEEIAWVVDGEASGLYLRSKPDIVGENVRRIKIIGEGDGAPEVEESWLIFSRPVELPDRVGAAYIEIAFNIQGENSLGKGWPVNPVTDSRLVAFFPTVVPTYLCFLIQGPYRTTPSRDNVPQNDSWNQYLVRETATRLVEALRWFRERDNLDVDVLRCLPLDRASFGGNSMFAPLFDTTRTALMSEHLLPRFGGGYVSGGCAKLARTQELRELLARQQLLVIFGDGETELSWLSGDITANRSPELYQYLVRELQ